MHLPPPLPPGFQQPVSHKEQLSGNPTPSGSEQNLYVLPVSPGEQMHLPPVPPDSQRPMFVHVELPPAVHAQPPPARTPRFLDFEIPTLPTRVHSSRGESSADQRGPTGRCLFCLDEEVSTANLIRSCTRHTYCKECFSRFIDSALTATTVVFICPHCANQRRATPLDIDFVREHASERGKRRLAQIEQDSLGITFECRRCTEKQLIPHSAWAQLTTITCMSRACGGSLWCKDCSKEVNSSIPHDCEVKRHEQSLAELAKSTGWKQCPGCKTTIERVSGCSRMRCGSPHCGTYFCFRCGLILFRMRPDIHRREMNEAIGQHNAMCQEQP